MVMYKIDRRGGGPWGGVQKSYTRTDPKYILIHNTCMKSRF